MKKRNFIFDFDGVIINSHIVQEKALRTSYDLVVGEGEPPFDDFFNCSGDSLANIFDKLGLPGTMIPIYRKVSQENSSLITLYKGMEDIIKKLCENNFSCALCTGKDRERTLKILNQFKLEKYFVKVVCSDDIERPKPDSQSIDKIMSEMCWDKKDTIMIGDGVNDILAAYNAGVKSIAVTWGECREELLLQYKPDYIAQNVMMLSKEIDEIIKQID